MCQRLLTKIAGFGGPLMNGVLLCINFLLPFMFSKNLIDVTSRQCLLADEYRYSHQLSAY